MAFTIDTETQKITFGVVADGTNDAISIPLADQFGATEDFNDDFSGADNFTDNGTNIQVNTTTDVIDWSLVMDADGTYIDLGVISDSAWLLRFKIDINAQSGVDNKLLIFGLFNNNVFDNTTSQDFLYFLLQKISPDNFIYVSNGNGVTSHSGTNDQFTYNPVLEVLYVELRRISATSFQLRIFSDPEFTILIESITQVISSSITGLRYLKAQVWDAGGLATMSGTIDNIQFWDGISTPVIRSDNWQARFKLDFTNLVDGGTGTDTSLLIGLSSEDATSGSSNLQDGFFLIAFVDNATDFYYIVTPNGEAPIFISNDNTFTIGPSVATIHYIEMIRESSTNGTINIYSDAGFTSLIQSRPVTGLSGTDNLRYLKLMNDETNTVSGSAIDGTFDDFTFTDLGGATNKTFTIDAILIVSMKLFSIDGLLFFPPAILYLIDAKLVMANFGLQRDIGDLILRVLTENPLGLTGDAITDKIREITEVELEWGFLGKKHRVKGWLNKLFKDNIVQNDGSDPDWWQSVWTLV